jgi:hypothetical protein
MGVKKALTAVVLAVALAAAPSAGFAQSQVDKTGTGGAVAGQELAGVPVVGLAIGAAIAAAIAVAIATAASDDEGTVSLRTTTTTATR